MEAEYTFIKLEKAAKIATITLSRPEKRNALNAGVIKELSSAFLTIDNDPDVRVVLLRSEGKVFSAGADLEYLQEISTNSFEENLADSNNLKTLFYQIYSCKKIVIGMVTGHAIAGGAGLVSLCDYAFSVPDASFGFTEVKLGFIPALVSVFLTNKIGEGKTRELLLLGNLITAEQARNMGLIYDIIPLKDIEEHITTFANNLIETTSPLSISMTKELLIRNRGGLLMEALNNASEMNAKMRETLDFKKGVSSFLNKGIPKWNE